MNYWQQSCHNAATQPNSQLYKVYMAFSVLFSNTAQIIIPSNECVYTCSCTYTCRVLIYTKWLCWYVYACMFPCLPRSEVLAVTALLLYLVSVPCNYQEEQFISQPLIPATAMEQPHGWSSWLLVFSRIRHNKQNCEAKNKKTCISLMENQCNRFKIHLWFYLKFTDRLKWCLWHLKKSK